MLDVVGAAEIRRRRAGRPMSQVNENPPRANLALVASRGMREMGYGGGVPDTGCCNGRPKGSVTAAGPRASTGLRVRLRRISAAPATSSRYAPPARNQRRWTLIDH